MPRPPICARGAPASSWCVQGSSIPRLCCASIRIRRPRAASSSPRSTRRAASTDAELIALRPLHHSEVAGFVRDVRDLPSAQFHYSLDESADLLLPVAWPIVRRSDVEVNPVLDHLRFRNAMEQKRRYTALRVDDLGPSLARLLRMCE